MSPHLSPATNAAEHAATDGAVLSDDDARRTAGAILLSFVPVWLAFAITMHWSWDAYRDYPGPILDGTVVAIGEFLPPSAESPVAGVQLRLSTDGLLVWAERPRHMQLVPGTTVRVLHDTSRGEVAMLADLEPSIISIVATYLGGALFAAIGWRWARRAPETSHSALGTSRCPPSTR